MTFVDIDIEALPSATPDSWDADKVLDAFALLQRRITDTETLLLRWPEVIPPDDGREPSHDERVVEHAQAWIDHIAASSNAVAMSQSQTGALIAQLGQAPRIVWANGHEPDVNVDDLTRRARAAELLGMLLRGDAIWKPRTYHYRLPSGAHDTVFVRVADAFRSTRDFTALATWLTRHPVASRDGAGVLVDTGTMTPIVSALHALQRAGGVRPGPVATLDEYPRTRLEVRRLARVAAQGANAIIGLLSVSSSGSVQEVMLDALEHGPMDAWTLDTLVDRRVQRTNSSHALPGVATWLTRSEVGLPPLPRNRCHACERNEQARVVQIHPRSFEALTLSEPELLMPDTKSARDSAAWWRLVADRAATGVECAPHQQSQASRPKGATMGVRVFLERILGQDGAEELLRARIRAIHRQETAAHKLIARTLGKMEGADTFLVSDSDHDLFSPHVEMFRESLRCPDAALVPENEVRRRGRDAVGDKVVVLLGGTVTGSTATRLRVALATEEEPELYGLVVHARPTGPNEWRAIRNTFSKGLRALWLTYLPSRSPLLDEAQTLGEWEWTLQDPPLSDAEKAFITDRLAYCNPTHIEWDDRARAHEAGEVFTTYAALWQQQQRGEDVCPPPPQGLLWGQPPRGHGLSMLRGYPLYGAALDPLTYYAAIGSAMQTSLLTNRARAAPQWLMFDMPAICRSYFDGPLVASILRWVEPRRAWWGARPSDAERSMDALLARTQPHKEDMLVLLPELLLAGAQGKIDRAALEVLVNALDGLTADWDDEERVPVEVGRKLVAYAHARRDEAQDDA